MKSKVFTSMENKDNGDEAIMVARGMHKVGGIWYNEAVLSRKEECHDVD